jgi:predicted nucleic acid-binding protein
MTDFILDANVLMSILLSGKSSYKPLLKFFRFKTPEFVLVEIDKYKEMLFLKTKLGNLEFLKWTYFVFSEVAVLPQYVIEKETLVKAEKLLINSDQKDIAYVALAMQLDIVLITRDVPLFNHLKKQGFRKVMLLENFLQSSFDWY